MTTRTVDVILDIIQAARAAYHAVVDTGNRHEVAALAAKIPPLQRELAAALSAGADDCPACEVAPVGMLKTPEVLDGDGNLKSGAVYEVGCLSCELRSRAGTPERAVARWNAGEYVKAKAPAV